MNRLRFSLSSALVIAAIAAALFPARTTASPSTSGSTPQADPEQTPVPAGFPYRPLPVVHPELMAGRWEAPDSSGTIDSLHIQLSTQNWIYEERLLSVTADVSIRLGRPGAISRSLSARLPGPVEYFRNPALNTVWVDNRLRLDSAAGIPIELDLVFDEVRMEWNGTVGTRGTSEPIRFTRPAGPAGAPRAGVGYWCTEAPEPGSRSCVRIAEGADGNVHAWRDSVTSDTKGVSWQGRYGSSVRVLKNQEPRAVSFVSDNEYGFTGRLSPDGTRLEGRLELPFSLLLRYHPNIPELQPHTFVKSETGAWPDSSRRP